MKSSHSKLLSLVHLPVFIEKSSQTIQLSPSFQGQLRVQHGLQTISKAVEKCLHCTYCAVLRSLVCLTVSEQPQAILKEFPQDAAGPQLLFQLLFLSSVGLTPI